MYNTNINEYGRFDELKNSVDKVKAKAYFEKEKKRKEKKRKEKKRKEKKRKEKKRKLAYCNLRLILR